MRNLGRKVIKGNTEIPLCGMRSAFKVFYFRWRDDCGQKTRHGMTDQRVEKRLHSACRRSLYLPPFSSHFFCLFLFSIFSLCSSFSCFPPSMGMRPSRSSFSRLFITATLEISFKCCPSFVIVPIVASASRHSMLFSRKDIYFREKDKRWQVVHSQYAYMHTYRAIITWLLDVIRHIYIGHRKKLELAETRSAYRMFACPSHYIFMCLRPRLNSNRHPHDRAALGIPISPLWSPLPFKCTRD